ncbi:MAG: hypothetical protein ACR2PF_01740 [Rhizobiaceae bacterium]
MEESSRRLGQEYGKLKTLAEKEESQKLLLSRLEDDVSLIAILETWKGQVG